MAFPFISSLNGWQRGFFGILLCYAVGLGGTVVLAQFMPVADMCNPGVPFFTGMITLMLGALVAFATMIAFLFGYRMEFIKGFLAAHSLILAGIIVLILQVTHSA
jgi:hypothetical protein